MQSRAHPVKHDRDCVAFSSTSFNTQFRAKTKLISIARSLSSPRPNLDAYLESNIRDSLTLSLSSSASISSSAPLQKHLTTTKTHGFPSWFTFGILPGLLLTTSVSILLIYADHTNKTFTGSLYNFVISNRATIQIVVQVVSHLLGLVHLFILTAVFNAFTRKWFVRNAVSLDCLKWWNSMCQMKFDTSLPLQFLLPLAVFIGTQRTP